MTTNRASWDDVSLKLQFQRDSFVEAYERGEEWFGVRQIRAVEEFFDIDMEGE